MDDDFTMAVNVSARQIDSDGFGDLVAWQLEATGCPPERLCLELTESAIMADPAEAVTRLGRLARLGVQLAIDDFGTGDSSLAYLQYLPITHLKIDRSFVARSAEPRGAALIEATIGIARALGLATVAEGIETPEQRRLVTDLGCDVGQGYLARPDRRGRPPRAAGRRRCRDRSAGRPPNWPTVRRSSSERWEDGVVTDDQGSSGVDEPSPVECVIELRDTDGGVVVDVAGEIDEATRDLLSERLSSAIDSGAMVQVDLTHVSFMDSWGLSAVLAAHADAVERGVGFEVSGASPQVAHLFVITGVAVDYGWPTTFTSDD